MSLFKRKIADAPDIGTSLALAVSKNGEVERFGTTAKIVDKLTVALVDRGRKAADVVQVALTESPLKATMPDGREISVDVSNVYNDGKGGPDAEDTVVTAIKAYAETVSAKVPGARDMPQPVFDTRYSSMWNTFYPTKGDPEEFWLAFQQGLVESLTRKGIDIHSTAEAIAVINQAPTKIKGILVDVDPGGGGNNHGDGFMLTTQGHMVQVVGYREYAYNIRPFNWDLSSTVRNRSGKAPGSTIATKVVDVVTNYRTAHQSR